jgi:hypothetical protein
MFSSFVEVLACRVSAANFIVFSISFERQEVVVFPFLGQNSIELCRLCVNEKDVQDMAIGRRTLV